MVDFNFEQRKHIATMSVLAFLFGIFSTYFFKSKGLTWNYIIQ
jgi:hypothetical protein